MPGLFGVVAVLGMVVALAFDRGRRSRPAHVAIAALSAYTLWSFASILWADAPGPALEGSQRTLLYLVCFACFAVAPWTPRALLVFLSLFVHQPPRTRTARYRLTIKSREDRRQLPRRSGQPQHEGRGPQIRRARRVGLMRGRRQRIAYHRLQRRQRQPPQSR